MGKSGSYESRLEHAMAAQTDGEKTKYSDLGLVYAYLFVHEKDMYTLMQKNLLDYFQQSRGLPGGPVLSGQRAPPRSGAERERKRVRPDGDKMEEEDFDMAVCATQSDAEPDFFRAAASGLQVLTRQALGHEKGEAEAGQAHTINSEHMEQKRENAKFMHAIVSDSGGPPQVRDAAMEKLMSWIERADV